jgi:2-polyprenyl-3-methyl-5-hydroxy-6-metoxy-1,4-benzoquinol methylase
MATKGGRFERFIQNKMLRPIRLKAIINIIKKLPVKTILDVGCMDDYILKRLPEKFDYYGIDDEPLCENSRIKKIGIENLDKKKKYDLVLATEVLEHIDNPIEGIKTLKSLSNRFILISVPNEPFFSLFRLFRPAKEHLWTIYPQALKKHLGMPILEKKACFHRTYIALWDMKRL